MDSADITKDIALLVIGAAIGLLPWLLDKVEIEMPKYIAVSLSVCAIVALAWGLSNIGSQLSPQRWRSRTLPLITVVCMCLAVASISWLVTRAIDVQTSASRIRTLLRVRFSGKLEAPVELESDNIESWYTLWTPSALVSFKDTHQTQQPLVRVPTNWAVFVIFKKPSTYRQLNVSFSSTGFPMWEVKAAHTAYAIINVSGDIPAGDLEIYAKQ